MGDDGDKATREQLQHAGWRNTHLEHESHTPHRAHVPIADGLIEATGILQRREGGAAL
jgi:hypothetical protein